MTTPNIGANLENGTTIEFCLSPTEKFSYTIIDNSLIEGKTGKPYIVKDNTGKISVLKINLNMNNTKFLSIYHKLLETKLNHFVPIEFVGEVEYITNATTMRTDRKSAVIMEYGGSDLYEVYTRLETISQQVKERPEFKSAVKAFYYKVLLTIVKALENAHNNNSPHNDLMPANILCGFDIKKYAASTPEELSQLEEQLINSRIFLCDMDPEPDYDKSITQSSMTQRGANAIMMLTSFNPKGNTSRITPVEKDIYALLAAYSWLTLRGDHYSAEEFSRGKFVTEVKDDAGKVTRIPRNIHNNATHKLDLMDLSEIHEKINEDIDGKGYFIREETGSYPMVYRPLDKFKERWEQLVGSISSVGDIEALVKKDDFSYDNISSRNDISSDEVTAITNYLGIFLLGIATNLNGIITRKSTLSFNEIEKKKPLEERITEINTKISEKEGELIVVREHMTELDEKYGKNKRNRSVVEELAQSIREEENLEQEKKNFEDEKKEPDDELSQINEKLGSSECNYTPEIAALTLIEEKYLKGIESTHSGSSIKEIIDKWNH